jgi:hypothetical protein
MAQYSPRTFFRHVPNAVIKQYFTSKGVLIKHDFSKVTEADIEPIYEAWLSLPDNQRGEMERDFKEIDQLACEGGIKAILDEAEWRGENILEHLEKYNGFHEKVFWLFLERNQYWSAVTSFCRADRISFSQWNECKAINSHPANVSEVAINALEKSLSNYFFNCTVEVYKRNESDYFFAYPEDYAQSSVEWENSNFKRAARHPAFEIIIVYKQKEGKISLYMKGAKAIKKDVRALFADAILGLNLGEFVEDERIYELKALHQSDAVFKFSPEQGIQSVAVKKLRLAINGTKERITLEANTNKDRDAIYMLRDKLFKGIPASQLSVTQVGIQVTFIPEEGKRASTKSFEISWPNSCTLKHDDKDAIIRKMLVDSGIEPKSK